MLEARAEMQQEATLQMIEHRMVRQTSPCIGLWCPVLRSNDAADTVDAAVPRHDCEIVTVQMSRVASQVSALPTGHPGIPNAQLNPSAMPGAPAYGSIGSGHGTPPLRLRGRAHPIAVHSMRRRAAAAMVHGAWPGARVARCSVI